MVQIPYPQIGSGATAPGTPLGEMIAGAKGFVCDLYQNFPDWSLGDPTGIGALNRGIWDQICRPDRGDPPLPELPPPGGQCECQLYDVAGSFALFGPAQPWAATLRGPIGLPRLYGLSNGQLAFGFYHRNAACTGWQIFNIVANFSAESWRDGLVAASLTSIVPNGGGPDLCGNRPPTYPPSIPGPGDVEKPINIPFSPTIVIPIGFAYIRPDIDIDIDASVDVGVDVNLDVGINFNFNLGGINISFGGGGGGSPPGPPALPPADPRNPPPVPPSLPPAPGLEPIKDDLDAIERAIADLIACACPPERQKASIQRQAANADSFPVPSGTFAATIELTQIPQNARSEPGMGGPDVFYAGWAWFAYEDGGMSERMPMDAQRKVFVPPRSSPIKFAYTLRQSYNGIARIHYFL